MSTTLYRHFGHDGSLLYVGIANEPPARLRQHRKDKEWWVDVRNTTHQVFDTRPEAEKAEREAIKAEHPLWNKQHNSGHTTKAQSVKSSRSSWAFKGATLSFDHQELAEFSVSSFYQGVSQALQDWAQVNARYVLTPEDYRPKLELIAQRSWKSPTTLAEDEPLFAALSRFRDNDFSVAVLGGSLHPSHADVFAQTILDMDEARWYRDWPWMRTNFTNGRDYHDLCSAPVSIDDRGLCTYSLFGAPLIKEAFSKYADRAPTRGLGRWTCWHSRPSWEFPDEWVA